MTTTLVVNGHIGMYGDLIYEVRQLVWDLILNRKDFRLFIKGLEQIDFRLYPDKYQDRTQQARIVVVPWVT